MPFNINEIRSQLTYGGARSNLFQVQFRNPANSVADIKVPFMVEATSIPDASIGTIQVPYFGRNIKLPGDRQYQDWSVAVINDEDYLIRNALEEWSNKINSFQGNLRTFATSSPLLTKSQAIVTHYGKTGDVIRVYKFNGIFPVSISDMQMDWNPNDNIQRFQATFAYDWWEVDDSSPTGNAGGV